MLFSPFSKNRSTILSFASDFITRFENDMQSNGQYTISCKEDILERVRLEIDSDKPYYSARFSPSDLRAEALRMVCLHSFELFESDKYRTGGYVNWSGPANNARYVHEAAMLLSVKEGFVDQEDADEDDLAFKDVIRMRY